MLRFLRHQRQHSTLGKATTSLDAYFEGHGCGDQSIIVSSDHDTGEVRSHQRLPSVSKAPIKEQWPLPSLRHNSLLDQSHFTRNAISGSHRVSNDPAHFSFTEKPTFQDIHRNVLKALRTNDPPSVLKALLLVAGPNERYSMHLSLYFRDLSQSTFSEILRNLDPKHFVARFEELHNEISARMARRLGIARFPRDGYLAFTKTFLNQVASIIDARCQHWLPALSDFKYLLRCARATGDMQVAERIWRSMENFSDISPDAECYNHLLATKCLDHGARNALWRYRWRLVPRNSTLRSSQDPPYELCGHRLGPNPGGIKATTSRIFQEMIQSGISGNEETFCYVMIAMAREGDISSVDSILKSVWNVDRAAIMADAAEMPVKEISLDSPFHPTDRLLFVIAHCFGINNEIPTALRIVDLLSRQYSIPISLRTWNELLQWTFVISHQYNRKYKKRGTLLSDSSEIPDLPPNSVANLWQTMVSEPYNIKPTMQMFNYLIISLINRRRWIEAQHQIHAAYNIFRIDIKHLAKQLIILSRSGSRLSTRTVIDSRMRQVFFCRLRVQRNRRYLQRWLTKLVKSSSCLLKGSQTWTTQDIPRLIKEWAIFLPHQAVYQVAMGEVKIDMREEKKQSLRQLRGRKSPYIKNARRGLGQK